jgi:WD40 repeat protein
VRTVLAAPPEALRFSPDGELLLTVSSTGEVAVWNAQTGALARSLSDAKGAQFTASFSIDGALAAAGGEDERVRLWQVAGGPARTLVGHHGLISAIEFSADGRTMITAAFDNVAKVWDLPTGRVLATLDAKSSILPSAALSADGALAALGTNDGNVQVWDARAGRLLLDRPGHGGAVFDISFGAQDGVLLTAGGGDRTARLWNVASTVASPAKVREQVRCRIGLELEQGQVVAASCRDVHNMR